MPTIWRCQSVLTAADVAEIAADPRARAETVALLQSLLAAVGDRLVGIFIFGSGGPVASGGTPDFILERSSFPTETGGSALSKLQADLDAQLAATYGPAGSEFFFVKTHFWNYKPDNSYLPRANGSGDFAFVVSNDPPAASWWQQLG